MEKLKNKEFPTYITHSLDPEVSPFLIDLINQSSAVVPDVDYTIADFGQGHRVGIAAWSSLFGEEFAQEADRVFQLKLEGQRRLPDELWNKRDEFNAIMKMTRELQQSCGERNGVKVFSRETDLIITAQKLGKILTKEEIEKGRDVYWDAVGRYSGIYSDAWGFLKYIKKMNRPLILMSGSDGIMKVSKYGCLTYDPQFSACRKQRRFQHLSFTYDRAVFGDPIDKPDPRFFNRVMMAAQNITGYVPKAEKILFIGDSLKNDLQVPASLGCNTVLIKRKMEFL